MKFLHQVSKPAKILPLIFCIYTVNSSLMRPPHD